MDNCIFCKIIAGDIPSRKIYEDEDCIVMLDISPATKGHALILPKKHMENLLEAEEKLLGKLLGVAKMIGKRQMDVLGAKGFNVVQNNFPAAGQTVMHLHVHVIPRYEEGEQIVAWTPHQVEASDLDELQQLLQ